MAPKTKTVSSFVIDDLRTHAKQNGINLHGAKTKKEIISHVKKHGSLHLVKHSKNNKTKSTHNGGGASCSSLGNISVFIPDVECDNLIEQVNNLNNYLSEIGVDDSDEYVNTAYNVILESIETFETLRDLDVFKKNILITKVKVYIFLIKHHLQPEVYQFPT